MIKAILFDVGGTLHTSSHTKERDITYCQHLIDRLHDYDIHLDIEAEKLNEILKVNTEEYKHYSELTQVELPNPDIWNDFYLKDFHIGREKLAPYAEELSFKFDYERPHVIRRPGMVETIKKLKASGYRLGIISNMISESVVPQYLLEYGISKDMECVLVSESCGLRKPNADIFRMAEQQLNLKPEEIAYVGDTISRDILGVRNAGWRLGIQISNPSMAFRDASFKNSGITPDYLITDFTEIPAIIAAENTKEA